MSSWAHLCISNFYLASNSSWIDPYLLSIFQKNDIKRFNRKLSERNKHAWGLVDSDEVEIAIVYSNTIGVIKSRLEVLGITMKKVLNVFNESKNKTIEELKYSLDHYPKYMGEYRKYDLATIDLLKSASFDDFIKAFNIIVENEYHLCEAEVPDNVTPIAKYILSEGSPCCEFNNFPSNYDFRILLRAVIENMDSNLLVLYDITAVVYGNYPDLIDANEDALANVYAEVLSEHHADSYELGDKIIILTEGTTDISVLENSLKILYPHLFDFYSFMNLNISNASGGASSLVSSVKSFISAGIKNKIIAIFDNDTAAFEARRGLANVKIPDNIKVINYPDITIANNYPALGPSGVTNMNVNGLACSIELYLGKDILLSNDTKQLTPVHWKGFNQSLNQYHGEIMDKSLLIQKFLKKTADCIKSPDKTQSYEWEEIHLILNTIFQAFNV